MSSMSAASSLEAAVSGRILRGGGRLCRLLVRCCRGAIDRYRYIPCPCPIITRPPLDPDCAGPASAFKLKNEMEVSYEEHLPPGRSTVSCPPFGDCLSHRRALLTDRSAQHLHLPQPPRWRPCVLGIELCFDAHLSESISVDCVVSCERMVARRCAARPPPSLQRPDSM